MAAIPKQPPVGQNSLSQEAACPARLVWTDASTLTLEKFGGSRVTNLLTGEVQDISTEPTVTDTGLSNGVLYEILFDTSDGTLSADEDGFSTTDGIDHHPTNTSQLLVGWAYVTGGAFADDEANRHVVSRYHARPTEVVDAANSSLNETANETIQTLGTTPTISFVAHPDYAYDVTASAATRHDGAASDWTRIYIFRDSTQVSETPPAIGGAEYHQNMVRAQEKLSAGQYDLTIRAEGRNASPNTFDLRGQQQLSGIVWT